MKKYIESCLQTDELIEKVKNSNTLPLIEKLHKKYGLKVTRALGLVVEYVERNYEEKPAFYQEDVFDLSNDKFIQTKERVEAETTTDGQNYSREETSEDCFMLSLGGMPYGIVYCTHSLISENLLFCIKFARNVKSRGTAKDDRRILKSFKVASILKGIRKRKIEPMSLYKANAVGAREAFGNEKLIKVDNIHVLDNKRTVDNLEREKRNVYYMSQEQQDALFDHHTKTKLMSTEMHEVMNKKKQQLDEVTKTIEDLQHKRSEIITASNLFLLGACCEDSLVVVKGKFVKDESLPPPTHDYPFRNYTFVVTDTEHVETIEDSKYFDKLASTVVLVKLALQDNNTVQGLFANESYSSTNDTVNLQLLQDLDINVLDRNQHNFFNMRWLIFPEVVMNA